MKHPLLFHFSCWYILPSGCVHLKYRGGFFNTTCRYLYSSRPLYSSENVDNNRERDFFEDTFLGLGQFASASLFQTSRFTEVSVAYHTPLDQLGSHSESTNCKRRSHHRSQKGGYGCRPHSDHCPASLKCRGGVRWSLHHRSRNHE